MMKMRNIPPSLTIPILLEPCKRRIEQWITSTTTHDILSLNAIELPRHAKIIVGTRCSSGGLGLPTNEPDTAPIAILCATLTAIRTLREIYTKAYPDGHLLLVLMRIFLSPEECPPDQFPLKDDIVLAKDKFIQIMELPLTTTLEELVVNSRTIQSSTTEKIAKDATSTIYHLLRTNQDRAGFLSQSSPGAACALMALPTDDVFKISPKAFSMLLRMKLFLSDNPCNLLTPLNYPSILLQDPYFRCPFCKHFNAKLCLSHILICPGRGLNIARHNKVTELFLKLLHKSGFQYAIHEPPPISNLTNKRTDIELRSLINNKAYDIAIPSPQATIYVEKAALRALHTAITKNEEKEKKHQEQHEVANCEYISIILESTSGAFLPRTLEEIAALTAIHPSNHHPPHNSFTVTDSFSYWTHAIAIAVVSSTMENLLDARRRSAELLYKVYGPHTQLNTTNNPNILQTTPNFV